jgi:hypothetical protein
VAANLNALNGNSHVTSIALTGTGTQTLTPLTVAQALGDTTALGKISTPYRIAISDTAANVASNLNALNSNAKVTSIALTGTGTQILTPLTLAQARSDTTALGKITTPYTITISDTAANIDKLTSSVVSTLSARHVTLINASDTSVALTADVAKALESASIRAAAPTGLVTVSDTAAHLQALTTTQIGGLPAIGVTGLNSSNANVTFNATQTSAILASNLSLSASRTHTVAETFTNGAVIASGSNGTGGGNLTLSTNANGLTVNEGASAMSVTAGSETISLSPYATESITAKGHNSDTFLFTPGFGHDTIAGLLVGTGTTHDLLEFNASAFGAGLTSANHNADLAALLSDTANNAAGSAVITDINGDSLTLNGVSKATLSLAANAIDFKFV